MDLKKIKNKISEEIHKLQAMKMAPVNNMMVSPHDKGTIYTRNKLKNQNK